MGSIPIGGATKQNDCVLFFYFQKMNTSEILRKFRFPLSRVPFAAFALFERDTPFFYNF